jgi:alpha-ribazole phosphatase
MNLCSPILCQTQKNKSMIQTDLYLIRHGEPVLTNALLGSTDSPLSEFGWQQLTLTMKNLAGVEQLIASPLSRCANFAQDFAAETALPLQIDPAWRECHFGDWDGMRYQDIHQRFADSANRFFANPNENMPPKSESLMAFSGRVEYALMLLLRHHGGKQIGVFTHAGVIRTLVAWCLQMDYRQGSQFRRFAIDYAGVTHLSIVSDSNAEHKLVIDSLHFPQLISLNQKFSSAQKQGASELASEANVPGEEAINE